MRNFVFKTMNVCSPAGSLSGESANILDSYRPRCEFRLFSTLTTLRFQFGVIFWLGET